ncbi:PREDICTED: chondroitin sulfate proteoglycan 4-like [Miniopterus natalensis]|uniref:chondroitin sulfate proteoglycan 4-like n=1 Tax=Miniopterus natalensis TaxID=291302 RepID=UPI0007A70F4A|nr:PREDICTED: chondroitin sulfate proteoglycan 4-like [Miniopterus natalensis]
MGNQAAFSFGQEDLDAGRLSYHMTDVAASEDQLQLSLFTSESNLTGRALSTRMQPLLRAPSNLTVVDGVPYPLRREDLDATELANRTNSNPRFEVTDPPTHGRLVQRVGRGPAVEDTTLFTQRDVDHGLVLLHPHASLVGAGVLRDSFTILPRADRVQPAVGYLPFTIVPPDALLWQTLCPDVSLLVTADDLVTSALPQEKPVVSSGPMTQTKSLGKLTQTRRQTAGPWGRHSGEGPAVDGKASPARVLWPPAATKASPGAPTQPRESSYPLMVIVPLAAVIFLLTVTLVALCVWLLGQKVEKAKPLIEPQASPEPLTPSPRPERSTTVPTVTVTPLLQSSRSPPGSLFRALPPEEVASPVTEAVGRCASWDTWGNLDPDTVQLCRQTNPTLKHNQYWV